jgi:hypothetical protein
MEHWDSLFIVFVATQLPLYVRNGSQDDNHSTGQEIPSL